MSNEIAKPAKLEEKHLRYLDALRESGKINMWAAGVPFASQFRDLSRDEASAIVGYWMRTFKG